MRIGKRALILLICGLFVATLLVSSVCIVRAANHICCGQRCLVCSVIARVEEMLHGLVLLLPAILAMIALFAARCWGWKPEKHRLFADCTLVNWKIRLNNCSDTGDFYARQGPGGFSCVFLCPFTGGGFPAS